MDRDVEAGQAVYTKRVLSVYDLVVLGISNRWIWRCPTRRILEHYDRHITANHLDVGVGTGYFPDRCRFPSMSPRLGLMDMNANSLEYASRRLARYRPERFRCNVLEPVRETMSAFDSVGVNYLLHCLPGSMPEKAAVFDHLAPLMNDGAVLFGSTLLQDGVERGAAARALMSFYNRKGIFSNAGDDLDGLQAALDRRFDEVSMETVGCVVLFSGRLRRGGPGGRS